VRAMAEVAAEDSGRTRVRLYEVLMNSSLVVPTPERSEKRSPGFYTADGVTPLEVVTLESPEGSVLPVFSSVSAMGKWRPSGGTYVAIPGHAVFEMAASADTQRVVLDPGSETSGWVSKSEIEALGRGLLPSGVAGEPIPAGSIMRIGRPASKTRPADDVIEAVRQALAGEPRVVAGWLFLRQVDERPAEMLVGVQLSEGVTPDDVDEAMQSIVHRAAALTPEAGTLSYILVDDDLRETLADGGGDLLFTRE